MTNSPIRLTIHSGVNGRVGKPIGEVTISDLEYAPARIVRLLRAIADTIESDPALITEVVSP